MDQRILFIRTGGTMDSEEYLDAYNPPDFVKTLKGPDSLVMPTVATLPNHELVDAFHWGAWEEDRFVKDSQEFTPDDINALADIIRHDDHQYFVLSHGTDAMAKNAKLLKEALKGSGKTVVFAGGMVPISMASRYECDAIDALRYTLENIHHEPAGVHMVARCDKTHRLSFFDPATVEKNKPESLQNLRFTVSEYHGR